MSIKFLSGFEYRNRDDDGWTGHTSGGAWIANTSIPALTLGTRSVRMSGIASSPLAATVGECWIGIQIRPTTTSSTALFGLSLGSATTYIEAGVAGGDFAISINGTTVSSSAGVSINSWVRLHLHVSGLTAGDTIRLYRDGELSTPIVEYTLTGGDVSGWPAAFTHASLNCAGGASYLDDLWIMDPTDATGVTDPQETLSFSVELLTADANGADFTFASGSFSDVDEIPFSLSDKITADAVGQIADLSFDNASTAQVIGAIKITQRTQRSGTTAGSQAEISIDDGSNNLVLETVTVPGDGYIRTYTSLAADGTALEDSKLNASTIQIKTVT